MGPLRHGQGSGGGRWGSSNFSMVVQWSKIKFCLPHPSQNQLFTVRRGNSCGHHTHMHRDGGGGGGSVPTPPTTGPRGLQLVCPATEFSAVYHLPATPRAGVPALVKVCSKRAPLYTYVRWWLWQMMFSGVSGFMRVRQISAPPMGDRVCVMVSRSCQTRRQSWCARAPAGHCR